MKFDLDLLSKAKYWSTLSIIIVLIGWVILATPLVKPGLKDSNWPWLNLGIDFQGGAQLTIPFEENVSTAEVRNLIAQPDKYPDLAGSKIQSEIKSNSISIVTNEKLDSSVKNALESVISGEDNIAVADRGMSLEDQGEGSKLIVPFSGNVTISQFRDLLSNESRLDTLLSGEFSSEVTANTISISSKGGIPPDQVANLMDELNDKYGVIEEEKEVNSVGQQISREFQIKAMQAIGLALLVILLYISWRFRLRYAVGAVAAVIHDVTIALAIFALFGIEINLPTIGAFLTIVGYSLNDTIVYFDRIRENSGKRAARSESTFSLINKSINQSLSRTLSTSTTTFIPVIALVLFGGPVLKAFSLALLIGVLVGTYSSIYVASPLVYAWDKYLASE
ncbi:protein translocase subunit SecF [Candidatus Bipolaricaulota bacterium]|nr:protein translocase subunit SecF [Candidatus Bipolaricaulota bacterium]